jgi:opacity protein-like surface antigen
MRKELLTSVCALSLLVGASTAYAGAYGEPVQAEETPAAPPAPRAVVVQEEEIDYAAPGFYIGAGGAYGIELFAGHDARVDNSGGFHVRAGYRIIPNLAVEVLYENFLQFDSDPGSVDAWTTTVNAKGYILTGRYQPYVLLGLGYIAGNGSGGNPDGPGGVAPDVSLNPQHGASTDVANPGNGFLMRFGVGMDAYITEHLSMGPEIAYDLPFGGASNLDLIDISLGLRYKF